MKKESRRAEGKGIALTATAFASGGGHSSSSPAAAGFYNNGSHGGPLAVFGGKGRKLGSNK
jgi:hypothetical protein